MSHFNVYRSQDPACHAKALNFIGTSEGTTYLDQTELNYGGWGHNRLDENTTYHYRVVPVDRFNNQGDMSEVIHCTTMASDVADAAPLKVEGVYTVHVSPLAPENYINLWFYTNFEKDVDKYMIHRGETADFVPDEDNLIHTLIPSGDSMFFSRKYSNSELNRQMYADKTAEVNKACYYRVCAVDNNGNRGEYSDPAFAIMNVAPVRIVSKTTAFERFEDFRPKATVSIECPEHGYELFYSIEDKGEFKGPERYAGEFEIEENKIISVSLRRPDQEETLYRHRRLVGVSQALSQSDYGESYGAAMAIDGSEHAQWVSKPYGGKTKEDPADVWLGVNLETDTRLNGLIIMGDDREMMPIQKDFRIFLRRGEALVEVENPIITADPGTKNFYEVDFGQSRTADGVMVFFDKDALPSSELPEQDGLVRIREMLVLTPEEE